ncbi:HAD family hydrolase [Humibacter ginsengisoli]
MGFDLDGTLFDHRGSAAEGVDSFLGDLGVQPSADARSAWFAAEDAGFQKWSSGEISFQEQRRYRLRTVLPALGVEPPRDGEALDALFDKYLSAYRAAWKPFPGAVEAIRAIRAGGLIVGVLTNGSHEQQLDKLRRTSLYDLIDVVCTAEELGVWKLDARAFQEFTRRLGVAPSECLFVGDHPDQDIAGAAAAGMPTLIVDHYTDDSTGFLTLLSHAIPAP